METSKKTTIITLIALIVLIGGGIGLFALLGSKNKPSEAQPTDNPTQTSGLPSETATVTTGGAAQTTATENGSATTEEVSLIERTSPVFSLTDCYYTEDVVLEITSPVDKEGEIYYTLDGSEPTKASMKYPAGGITLPEGDKQLVKEWESFYQYPHEESWDVNGYIVKARIFYTDGSESPTRVHTYLVNKNIQKRYENYVLCISGDPKDLTDRSKGILAGGSGKRGKESERTAFAELYTSTGVSIFHQYIGIRPYGGASRGNTIKSFKMYARKDSGSDIGKFKVPSDLFGTKATDGSLLDSYDRLVVRAGGNDMNFGFLRDEMNQTLMRLGGYPVTEGSVPVIVYVNGEYYGMLWLHENYCDDYFKDLFPKEEASGEFVVLEGGDTYKNAGQDPDENEQYAIEDYNSLYKVYAYSDLTDEDNYKELRQRMDVENYLDYFAFNIYLANNDWPNNNYKCYRYIPADGEALGEGVYDGRWRYLPHDMDFGQYLYHNNDRPHETDSTTGASNNSVARVCDPNNEKYAPLFDALMKRKDCREYFIGKIISLGNTILSYPAVSSVMSDIVAKQEKELDIYLPLIRKLGRNEWWPSHDNTRGNYELIGRFHKERLEYLLTYFEQDYGYTRDELLAMKP